MTDTNEPRDDGGWEDAEIGGRDPATRWQSSRAGAGRTPLISPPAVAAGRPETAGEAGGIEISETGLPDPIPPLKRRRLARWAPLVAGPVVVARVALAISIRFVSPTQGVELELSGRLAVLPLVNATGGIRRRTGLSSAWLR